ncbi:unnamed protein product, partial [Polarella glacialis]
MAPRDKTIRLRAAELFWRLLAASPAAASCAEQAVLLRLSRDKVPHVRLAAVPGLALLGTTTASGILADLAGGDPSSRVRLSALSQLQTIAMQVAGVQRPSFADILGRSLDAAPLVRGRLYATLASLGPAAIGTGLAALLRRGLGDSSSSVRCECECMLRTWLDQHQQRARVHTCPGQEVTSEANEARGAGSVLSSLLWLVGELLEKPSSEEEDIRICQEMEAEAAAEAALRHILSRSEWHASAAAGAQALVAGAQLLSKAQVLVGRVGVSLDADLWNSNGALSRPPVLNRTLLALEAGRSFELRQLLMVLMHAEVHDDASARALLHIATAVLLRAPVSQSLAFCGGASPLVGQASSPAATSVFHLAVLVARKATLHGRLLHRRAEVQFSESMLVILRVLQDTAARAVESSPQVHGETITSGGLEALGAFAERCQAKASETARRSQQMRSAWERATGARDFVTACKLQEELASLRAEEKQAADAAECAFEKLGSHSWRVLAFLEAVLSHSRADLAEDFPLSLISEDVLRPALLRTESVPAPTGAGRICWLSLRALAVRCLALHASLSSETAWQHWRFFLSVLARYVPEVLCPNTKKSGATTRTASELVVINCIAFLSDTLLLCRLEGASDQVLLEEGKQKASIELFDTLAPLFAARHQLSPSLRQELACRLCTLSSLCGLGLRSTVEAVASPSQCWAFAWLLLEAFLQRPPSAQSGARCRHEAEAVELAVSRGRLLRFFASLGRLSPGHTHILFSATEGFLSLDLWRLGSLIQVGAGQRWCALPFPRLVRFVSHELTSAASRAMTAHSNPGSGANATAAALTVQWLECLWRPLALICLETAVVAAACESELPQALLGAITATTMTASASSGNGTASVLAFVPIDMRSAVVSEVAWVLNRAVELWGAWNAAGNPGGRSQPHRTSTSSGTLPAKLVELRSQLAAESARSGAASGDWARIYCRAEGRRLRLRDALQNLGVHVSSVVTECAAAGDWRHMDEKVTAPKTSRPSLGGQGKGRGRGQVTRC